MAKSARATGATKGATSGDDTRRVDVRDRDARFFSGVDENGLGPLLGPLVVTGVLAHVTSERARDAVHKKAPRALRARLSDSKALVSHDDNALGEAWARELVGLSCAAPAGARASKDRVIGALMRDPRERYLAMCPTQHADHCFGESSRPAVDAARDEEMRALAKDVARDRDKLAAIGIELVGASSVVVCNRMLNDAQRRGVSRFVVDLHAMEQLVLDFRARAGERISATCGKVGGFDFYEPAFGPLAGHLKTTLVESRKVSAYEVAGVGRIAFVMDADASNMLVSLASLVGKWVRDALMGKILDYYGAHDARLRELPRASGYHDPVTRAFVAASALVRNARRVEDDCFARRSAATSSRRPVGTQTKQTAKAPRSPRSPAP